MANYGPPGRGDPEPWRGRQPDEAYGTSAGSYGRGGWDDPHAAYPPPEPRYGAEPYRRDDPGPYRQPPPAYGPAGQPYAPWPDAATPPSPYAGGPTPPPERRRGRGPLVAVLAAVAVLVLGGGAAVYYLLGQGDEAPVATPSEPVPAGTGVPEAPASTPTAAPSAPAPESSADPRFVKAGQCVRNDGPAGGKPKLLISDCGPQTYEVLRRIDGATSGEKDAAAKCAKVAGYTNWYFFDSELDTLDFVLCLKQR
ncbi:hypothetical protein GA0070606_3321 [Micromonospora citrea]|uniref:Flagellar basal body-associated protein FliL n=1 Tax=Micromonospora citrea TaxID=47855 RepID=A0A1C6V2Z1_9ACTN|nr:hypothetical protein GA0070606_3321 [Micromonospora citrea]